jgi:hypothetical protein
MTGAGSATATISGSSIAWTGTATASVPGNNACAVALSGTLDVTATGNLSVSYAGTTCLGAVSGTETLSKR